jgi:hypothetical protein
MPDLIERDCAEHIHWHPYVTIEKYSLDQTAYAQRKLAGVLGWHRLPLVNLTPLGERAGIVTARRHAARGRTFDLHGDYLRSLFPSGPEDGMTYDDGNLMVNKGLTVVIELLTANGGTTYYPFQNNGSTNNILVGVGAGSTAATTADTALTDDNTSNAYYQGMDSGYPTVTTPATINGQCTYASGNANFAWNEWCWATGAGTVTAGTHLSAIFATSASINMINHKVPASSLGTKASGASWVFSTTIVFS